MTNAKSASYQKTTHVTIIKQKIVFKIILKTIFNNTFLISKIAKLSRGYREKYAFFSGRAKQQGGINSCVNKILTEKNT